MNNNSKELRPRFAIIDEMMDQMGGVHEAARRTGIPEVTLRTWEQRPERSGREPTVLGILALLAATADEPLNLTLRQIARELISHFSQAANMRVSTEDALVEIRYVLALLEKRAGLPPALKTYRCNECGTPLQVEAFVAGVPVFAPCKKEHAHE